MQKNTKNLFFREKATMPWMNLFTNDLVESQAGKKEGGVYYRQPPRRGAPQNGRGLQLGAPPDSASNRMQLTGRWLVVAVVVFFLVQAAVSPREEQREDEQGQDGLPSAGRP